MWLLAWLKILAFCYFATKQIHSNWNTAVLSACVKGSTSYVMHVLKVGFFPHLCHPTLWSRCECQPSHCGSRWRWAGWRHSRFSGLPERRVEPFPHPSARETARSCRRPMQVSNTHTLGPIAEGDHRHRMPPSNLISAVVSRCSWRPQARQLNTASLSSLI